MVIRFCFVLLVSFGLLAAAEVPYTETTESAKRPCGSLISQTTHDYSVISADLIEASGEAPEHCRVRILRMRTG